MEAGETRTAPEIGQLFGVVWRRKWLVLPIVLVMPIVAHLIASNKPPVYSASADVLLNRQIKALSGIEDPSSWNPGREIRTQLQLARMPEVARLVVEASGLTDRGPFSVLGQSFVDNSDNSDVLTFSVNDGDPEIAERLANEYATQYIAYRLKLDTAALKRASEALRKRIAALRADGLRGTPVYATAVDRQNELLTAMTLQSSNASLVRPAVGAGQIGPRPMRSTMLAGALAVMIALGLAFVVDSLDQRVRSADEVASRLGLPLLARLSDPSGHVTGGVPVLLARPTSRDAEAFRILRTSLEFENVRQRCRTILVTSAVDGEGKSSTLANLALALAVTGRRVVVVDLDLKAPALHELFGAERVPGIADVVLERHSLDQVVHRLSVDLAALHADAAPAEASRSQTSLPLDRPRLARMDFVPAGSPQAYPGEFVASAAVADALGTLASGADVVLVDAPPMLVSGDTLALSATVDGILVVARSNVVRRPHLRELERLLAVSPATKLGVVVAGGGATTTTAADLWKPPPDATRVRKFATPTL